MQNVLAVVKLIMDSANQGHGRELDAMQVQEVARYIMAMEAASNEFYVRAMTAENMVNAYMNEYGDPLFDELMTDGFIEAEVVGDDITEETGLSGENDGLDTQAEEEEE
jgi:hypothetical protein